MKIEFNAVLTAMDGRPMSRAELEDGKQVQVPVTIGWVAQEALLSEPQEERISAAEKLRRYRLADMIEKIRTGKSEAELRSDEVEELKELVGKRFPPLVVGKFHEFFS